MNDGNSYKPPLSSSSTTSRHAYYQYYDNRLRSQQNRYRYGTSRLQPTYLSESLTNFNPVTPLTRHPTNYSILPPINTPIQRSRQSSVSDMRLATANEMRERLLTNIQRNISEIDEELIALKRRPSITKSIQSSQVPVNNALLWPNRPKKLYQVIPRIKSEIKSVSPPKLSNELISHSYVGQYHYGPEIEEIEIYENDPENSEFKSTVDEIPCFDIHEIYSTEQSVFARDRALVSVPIFGNSIDFQLDQSANDLIQNDLIDKNNARTITAQSIQKLSSANSINIQDFNLLIQTAPEPEIQPDLVNTMHKKPVKHAHLSTKPEATISSIEKVTTPIEDKPPITDAPYFFSDFGNEGEGDDDLISIGPEPFTLPTNSEIITDDNLSNILIKQSHSSQQSRSTPNSNNNNNKYDKETERKKIDTPTNDIINSISPSALQQNFDNAQIQFSIKNNDPDYTDVGDFDDDVDGQQPTILKMTLNEQSLEKLNPLTTTNLIEQSSTSFPQYVTSIENDLGSSPLPVLRHSPDLETRRSSIRSRSTTPERRNSISLIDKNTLLASTDLLNFDDSTNDYPQTISSQHIITDEKSTSPLIHIQSDESFSNNQKLQNEISKENHLNFQIKSPIDEKLIINDEEFHSSPVSFEENDGLPFITASQQRSKLSLIVRKPQQTKTHSTFIEFTQGKKSKTKRQVLFSNEVELYSNKGSHSSNNWRERIDAILTKKRFPRDKFAHIKSRVNTFSNFQYRDNSKQKQKSKLNSFGRVSYLPDGRRNIFSEKLQWNSKSKLKTYSFANIKYRPPKSDIKIFDEKPMWHSQSKLTEILNPLGRYEMFIKPTPRRETLMKTVSLSTFPDDADDNQFQQSQTEIKIFDIKTNDQPTSKTIEKNILTNVSVDFQRTERFIFNKKFILKKKSKLKDLIWENIDYQPKKSTIQISHQPIHWNKVSKIKIIHSVNWHRQAKIKYWSEIDLRQLINKKGIFAEYHEQKWNDVIKDYPLISLTRNTKIIENIQNDEESPANRPKWNSVSKTKSLNSIYNPNVANSNTIRRGWDLDLRRKRVHRLPPIIRNENSEKISQSPDERMTNIEYGTISSRRSSKILAPLHGLLDLQLSPETPRSQRPVQQEWYDDVNKSRLTNRTDLGRTTRHSFRESIGTTHHMNTPRDFRSSTRNSHHSSISSTLLDSTIRTNRATELRLSRDMDEHHRHSHEPHESMPIEIRGFKLEGAQLTVPDDATIRPLSNINYRSSEHIKNHRIFPWSTLHSHGTISRNSSLVPIAEFRPPSLNTSYSEAPQLIREE